MPCFVRHGTVNRLQHSVNRNFICSGTKKFMWFTLLQYLVYCSGLELNIQYVQGMYNVAIKRNMEAVYWYVNILEVY